MKRQPNLDIDAIMEGRFTPGTTPRSPEYRRGFQDKLIAMRDGGRIVEPYQYGTCQADAWTSGISDAEHHVRWLAEKQVSGAA